MKTGELALDEGTLVYQHAGRGPLVVFSHALGPVSWGPLEQLQQSCTVAVPVWEESSIGSPAWAGLDWLPELALALGHERAALCAWSMAGPAAIEYAADEPPGLSHLILVDVAGLGSELPRLRWRDLPHVLWTQLTGRPTRGFVRSLWRQWVRNPAVDRAPLEAAMHRFMLAEAGRMGGPPDDDDDDDDDEIAELLSSIAVPTLVLAGRHSPVLGPELGRTLVGHCRRGELVVFEESSHTLQLEEPERFQQAVAQFCA